jgi:hypothetical protein
MEQETRQKLARAVERYCAEHRDGLIEAEAFDKLLFSFGVITEVPGVGSVGRFGHTQLRHKARSVVRRELRKRELDLALDHLDPTTGAGVFVLRGAMESAVKRLNRTPHDAQRMWIKRIGFMAKTWESGWSEMAKGLPRARRDAFLQRVRERVLSVTNEELRDLHFLYSSIGQGDWSAEVGALMDAKDPPRHRPKERKLELIKPDAKKPRRRKP